MQSLFPEHNVITTNQPTANKNTSSISPLGCRNPSGAPCLKGVSTIFRRKGKALEGSTTSPWVSRKPWRVQLTEFPKRWTCHKTFHLKDFTRCPACQCSMSLHATSTNKQITRLDHFRSFQFWTCLQTHWCRKFGNASAETYANHGNLHELWNYSKNSCLCFFWCDLTSIPTRSTRPFWSLVHSLVHCSWSSTGFLHCWLTHRLKTRGFLFFFVKKKGATLEMLWNVNFFLCVESTHL